MEQLLDFFQNILQTESWPARWVCGKWSSFHGWLYILSNLAITLAYYLIPLYLFLFLRKRKDSIPFVGIFWLFILFILACGTTHLFDALMFWYPVYRLSAVMLFLTSIISLLTVVGLIKILPEALSMKSPTQLEEIIYQRTNALEKSNAHLKEIHEDLDNFIYSASHDLKSPINNLEGLFQIVEMELKEGKGVNEEILKRIKLSITRSKETIVKLTDVIKVQSNPYEDIQQVRFSEVLKEVLYDNDLLLQKNRAKVLSDFQVETIEYSNIGIKSILYNLISNAAKYASPERTPIIEVKTFMQDGRTMLTVKDNGLGMDLVLHKEKLFKLFKRFHDHVEGSGIGLYTIKKMIENQNGTITIESELGIGTVFSIQF